MIVDVPLIFDKFSDTSLNEMLWTKGKPPENDVIARFSVMPVQVASIELAGSNNRTIVLWRAFAGGGISVLRSDDLNLKDGPRYFCGLVPNPNRLTCFIDKDGDGSFDHLADAVPERGSKPYHITIIRAVTPLAASQPYQILGNDLRPSIDILVRNCAKDYDRPRFSARSASDQVIPMLRDAYSWDDKDSSFASCRRGSQLSAVSGKTVSIPSGGYLARIGEMAFTVGSKDAPKLTLIGPADPYALYRLEAATLVDARIGRTPIQAQLLAFKQFPYPMMMVDEGAVIHKGRLQKGERLASIPFHHAYRGKLTQQVSIKTLFGKRSLPADTVVYGFPAQSRITSTRNGTPDMTPVGDDEYRKINLDLTWCAPVRDAVENEDKANRIGKGGWSASCIPKGAFDNHTIISNMTPAFAISSVSYSLDTSSNAGPPPIKRSDESTFAQPLRIDYMYEGREGEFISLSELVYFGDELTSRSPKKIYAPSGVVVVEVAGMQIEATTVETGDLNLVPQGLPKIGSNPYLKWDQRAMMLRKIERLGLKPSMTPNEIR